MLCTHDKSTLFILWDNYITRNAQQLVHLAEYNEKTAVYKHSDIILPIYAQHVNGLSWHFTPSANILYEYTKKASKKGAYSKIYKFQLQRSFFQQHCSTYSNTIFYNCNIWFTLVEKNQSFQLNLMHHIHRMHHSYQQPQIVSN